MADTEYGLRSLSPNMLEYALAYAKKGWPVFPCWPKTKKPATPHGFKDASTDEGQIRSWWADNPQFNIAIATGSVSGLFVFDVDQKPGRTLEEALDELPKIPDAPTVLTGGGGYQYFWKYPEGSELSISGGKLGVGIDTRGNGGYVVVPPSLHPTGNRYRWYDLEEAALPDTPPWVIERLEVQRGRAVLSGAEKLTGGRHDTLMTAAALMRGNGFIPAEIYAALDKMRDRLDVSDGRVIEDKEIADIANWCAEKDVGAVNIGAVAEGAAIARGLDVAAKAKEKREGFRILGPEEWRVPLPKRVWLIERFLPLGGVGALCSSPGKGKSLVGVELAEAVALGRDFGGFQTNKGNVLYCAPDSPLSMQYRLQGASADAAANIYFAPTVRIPADFDRLERDAKAGGWAISFSLIIVDTYDRAREHNDSGSAGQDALIQRVVGAARDFAYRNNCCVLFMHHTTRADEERMRGSQSFDGLCDMIGAISKASPDTVTISCLKMRDGEEFKPITWDIAVRPGLSEDGEDVPYLTPSASQTMEAAARGVKTAANEAKVLNALALTPPSGGWTIRALVQFTMIPVGTMHRTIARMKQKGTYPK